MTELIGLDFETYGATDLPKHGLQRYTRCDTFTPLIGSVAYRHRGGVNSAVPPLRKHTFNFITDRRASVRELGDLLIGRIICAHNAGFEERVLDVLGIRPSWSRIIDSAVVARAAGAGSSLEAAAPQLLDVDKLEAGKDLIRTFSIPGKYQESSGSMHFNPQVIEDHPDEWDLFQVYCELDAELSLRIVEDYGVRLTRAERAYAGITSRMNRAGWKVDVELVQEMQRRYLENQELALHYFRLRCDAQDLNLNSLKQLKEWCAERGVKATSFDEKHVAKLLAAIEKKRSSSMTTPDKSLQYGEVEDLLRTKQVLGGASLKKLQTILDTQHNGRLYDQYLHCGAGQTLRTTGRSVQMQNLKRLGRHVPCMEDLYDEDVEWDNDALAANLRQVFTATEEDGRLIVGDFSSVESRGLAWMAGEEWKLDAYRQGKDVYKMQASLIYGSAYDLITKEQRQTGKVGELSCGYGAGAGAVQSFADGMGVVLTEAEAAKLVSDWRVANPATVVFWAWLDEALHAVVEELVKGQGMRRQLPHGMQLVLEEVDAPKSLDAQHPGSKSVRLMVRDSGGEPFLLRYFHGCHVRGRNICYYKPSDRKTGDLWRSTFTDPKTKQLRFYELYGGKLAGILTQSFCRELFFRCLQNVDDWATRNAASVELVGQFHDEIVVDWRPGGSLSLPVAKDQLKTMMSDAGSLTSFPLDAEIKDDYRYTK